MLALWCMPSTSQIRSLVIRGRVVVRGMMIKRTATAAVAQMAVAMVATAITVMKATMGIARPDSQNLALSLHPVPATR